MRRSQFNLTQIATILKEFEQGNSTEEIDREYGVRYSKVYNRKKL